MIQEWNTKERCRTLTENNMTVFEAILRYLYSIVSNKRVREYNFSHDKNDMA